MRFILAALAIVVVGATPGSAQADPYKWCAEYAGGGMDGSSNCYFMTLQQCQWQVSGVGGFCRPNGFYDGKPVVTPDDRAPAQRRAVRRGKKHQS